MPFRPHDAATHVIGRARGLLETAQMPGLPANVPADLRRLSVVMAVAALDAYMHQLVVTRAYEHTETPGGLATLTVTFDELLAEADAAVAARAEDRNARPRVRVKRVLRDRLLRETVQRSDDVSRALGMAGKSGKWQDIADAMPGVWDPKNLRARLDEIVDRRNAIVHEGDYARLDRPQTARLIGISQAEATGAVNFLANLIDAIHAVS